MTGEFNVLTIYWHKAGLAEDGFVLPTKFVVSYIYQRAPHFLFIIGYVLGERGE